MLCKMMEMEERIVLDAAPVADVSDAPAENDAPDTQNSDTAENTAGRDFDTQPDDNQNDDAREYAGDSPDTHAAPDNPPGGNLLIVNQEVDGYQTLVDAAADDVATLLYDNGATLEDILAQIESRFSGEKFSNIALATHGAAGTVDFTDDIAVTAETLTTDAGQQAFFNALGQMLAEDGHLDVLSCFSAAGESGDALVNALREATGHEVAASTDATGSGPAADWVLETAGRDIAGLYFTATDDITARMTENEIVITVNTESDVVNANDNLTSLREAFTEAQTFLVDNGKTAYICFDSNVKTLALSQGALEWSVGGNEVGIHVSLIIDGGHDGVTISAAGGVAAPASIFLVTSNHDSGNFTVQNLTLKESATAISVSGIDQLLVKECTFSDNQSSDSGAAIKANEVNRVEIYNSDFANNISQSNGGAIYLMDAASTVIHHSTFHGNYAGYEDIAGTITPCGNEANGGAIFCGGEKVSLEVYSTKIYGNKVYGRTGYEAYGNPEPVTEAGYGGGICFKVDGALSIINTPYAHNFTEQLRIENSDIYNNTANNCGGGVAILFSDSNNPGVEAVPEFTIKNSWIYNNTAGNHASGNDVYVKDASLIFKDSWVNANQVRHEGRGAVKYVYSPRPEPQPFFPPSADTANATVIVPGSRASVNALAQIGEVIGDMSVAVMAPLTMADGAEGDVAGDFADGESEDAEKDESALQGVNSNSSTAQAAVGALAVVDGSARAEALFGDVASAGRTLAGLGKALGAFGDLRMQISGTASEGLAAAFDSACNQSITLSVLTLHAQNLNLQVDALLVRLAMGGNGTGDAVAFAAGGSGATGEAGADNGEVSAIIRECRKMLVEAQNAAGSAQEMLQMIAENIIDFSDRIVENSFNAGLKRVLAANENLALRYEILNGVVKHVQAELAAGREITPVALKGFIAGLTREAREKAKTAISTADRASTDTLALMVRQMEQATGAAKDGFQTQVMEMLAAWHHSLGLSDPVIVKAAPAPLAFAN